MDTGAVHCVVLSQLRFFEGWGFKLPEFMVSPAAQVLDCVSQHVHVFDEVNVATALHRLAKLQPPGPSGQSSPIVYADQFQQLVAAVSRLLHRFEAQAVSNTMWGGSPNPLQTRSPSVSSCERCLTITRGVLIMQGRSRRGALYTVKFVDDHHCP